MASAVDSRLAYARLSAVATASRLPTANRGSNNSYTTSWDTTASGEVLLGVEQQILCSITVEVAPRVEFEKNRMPPNIRVNGGPDGAQPRNAEVATVGVNLHELTPSGAIPIGDHRVLQVATSAETPQERWRSGITVGSSLKSVRKLVTGAAPATAHRTRNNARRRSGRMRRCGAARIPRAQGERGNGNRSQRRRGWWRDCP